MKTHNDGLLNREGHAKTVESLERLIASRPSLDALDDKSLESVARYVALRKYVREMERDADLLECDYFRIKESFLKDAVRSANTRMAYANAFRHFEERLEGIGVANPFSVGYAQAERISMSLQAEGFSAASARQFLSAISSLFDYACRITDGKVKNVFSSLFSRPAKKAVSKGKFYEKGVSEKTVENVSEDIEAIRLSFKSLEMRAIIRIMMDSGLRVGSFTSRFSFCGRNFKTRSKGKDIKGVLTGRSLAALKEAGLDEDNTFRNWNADKIKNMFKYHSRKLYVEGRTSFEYSCHDIRHVFAIRCYLATRDIYAVSRLLGHSNVVVTEEYLRGLNVRVGS